jgi:hypothetical protein
MEAFSIGAIAPSFRYNAPGLGLAWNNRTGQMNYLMAGVRYSIN